MMSGSQLIEATFIYLGLTGEACYIAERKSERNNPKVKIIPYPFMWIKILYHLRKPVSLTPFP